MPAEYSSDTSYVDPATYLFVATFGCTRRCSTTRENISLMRKDSIEIENICQLRQFVSQTLCHENDIEEGIFQVTEKVLTKCGETCGILFCLHGPRSVKLTAIWETISNSIIFYGSSGERFKKTVLTEAPTLLNQAV